MRRQVVDALAVEQNFAARHFARGLEQTDDGRASQRFAGTRLAHHTQNFARSNVERHFVQRPERAVAVGELHHQIVDLQQRSHRSLGFKASRNQSPSKLTLSAMTTSMAPGKMVIHHSPENR